jgi:hypothetical protein
LAEVGTLISEGVDQDGEVFIGLGAREARRLPLQEVKDAVQKVLR